MIETWLANYIWFIINDTWKTIFSVESVTFLFYLVLQFP